ncbi:DUF5133 domain-containing protein [Streptomyces sp. NPDC054838]
MLRSLVEHTLAAPVPPPDPVFPGPLPDPALLRGHLHRFRTLRRAASAAPDDAGRRRTRSRLDDASYTLCVLMGRRSTRLALRAAEELLAADRPDRPSRLRAPYRWGRPRGGPPSPVSVPGMPAGRRAR